MTLTSEAKTVIEATHRRISKLSGTNARVTLRLMVMGYTLTEAMEIVFQYLVSEERG